MMCSKCHSTYVARRPTPTGIGVLDLYHCLDCGSMKIISDKVLIRQIKIDKIKKKLERGRKRGNLFKMLFR